MAERAAEAGGALRVTSAPGAGTTVEVTLPAAPLAAAPVTSSSEDLP
jgi:nitrate/nitrite-specific signal transduction histidine kinase